MRMVLMITHWIYDGRSGTFVIGNDCFPASLLDLPTIVESYKTYDDNVLIKTADVGQMIVVGEEVDPPLDVAECRHGLTPPMRDARRRRFRREPDLNPELVQRVEKDLLNIMNGGTAENFDVDMTEQNDIGDMSAHNTMKKAAPALAVKHDVAVAGTNVVEPERSDSDDSDSYIDMD
ncbi:putative TAFII55 protein region [Helianthus debilis subsp. tardiflorus]